MNKQHILKEIRRTAEDNDGVPLGVKRFLTETGIKESDWAGKFWVRWGDALLEAGFPPNQWQTAFSDDLLIEKFARLIRELGRFPVRREVYLKRRNDLEFPSYNPFKRFGSKKQFSLRIVEYCRKHGGYDDIVEICLKVNSPGDSPSNEKEKASPHEQLGFVYLLKSGRYFKIGKTNAAGRREYELAIQLPDKAKTVHVIKTDDPTGIEAYWHKRFEDKWRNGEWFELTSADVKAFTRRKFM